MITSHHGFSLWELMSLLSLLGILSAMSIPHIYPFLMRTEREIVLEQLKTAIEYAKQEAFLRGVPLTLCASPDTKTCQARDWSPGYLLFENRMATSQPQPSQILYVFSGTHYGKLHFESFGPNKNLNIEANGMTVNSGAFLYCPYNKDPREAEALIINKASRTYRPTQKSSRGILIKNAGTPEAIPLLCR